MSAFAIKPIRGLLGCVFIVSLAVLANGCGKSPTPLSIDETFTNPLQVDFAASTGLWNSVDNRAQAAAVADASAARPISFGDGSDGTVSSTNGYTFDTDANPNGYDFVSLSITGGTITVSGANPLVIRALKDVTLTPTLSIDGGGGIAGSQTGGNLVGPTGATARAGRGNGGAGGAVAALASAMDGGAGLDNTGATDAATIGAGSSTVGTAGGFGTSAAGSPGANLDITAQFTGGAGGGGGGGHGAGADATKATGGSGAAGGGIVRISALGLLTVGAIHARGGRGGDNAVTTSRCSGVGAGGNGGAAWLQSLRVISAITEPLYSGGLPGTASGTGCTAPLSGLSGYARADSPVQPASWVGGANVYYSTVNAATSQTYTVQSKAYDLNVNNAGFKTEPTLTQTLNGGTIAVTYAASVDNVTYTSFGSSLIALSNQNYKYLKIRISISTAAVAGPSPYVSRVSIGYQELSPPASFDGELSGF